MVYFEVLDQSLSFFHLYSVGHFRALQWRLQKFCSGCSYSTLKKFRYSCEEWDSNVQRTYGNWRSKLEITKSREAEKSKKNRERRRNGKEEEAEAGGETAVDQMEVAGDMEVTGDVVILVQNLFGIKILRMFLILLEGVPIFF
ncbi:uncharacterized protein LOC115966541 [Quercus lobata]|uniref:uncharacterized protein LOC115966541 n=1 Tax=Quercus lobata TaxID=97700 RepID=UPI001247CEA2|nr:uncharacterized protein LOC115966541 [Quercus lobata]